MAAGPAKRRGRPPLAAPVREEVVTVQRRFYLHADLRLKERALAHTMNTGLAPGRFRPDDALLAFLEGL